MIATTVLQVLQKFQGSFIDYSSQLLLSYIVFCFLDITETYGHSLSDAVYVQLHVAKMSHYKSINAIYSNFFSLNPPSRTCIGIEKGNMSGSKILQMYSISYNKPCNKKSMHVQGISHWAPANIGTVYYMYNIGIFLSEDATY